MEIGKPTSALEIHQHIVSFLQKPDPVILDVGCYEGADSLRFLRLAQRLSFTASSRPPGDCSR